jgi:hypothetical protein
MHGKVLFAGLLYVDSRQLEHTSQLVQKGLQLQQTRQQSLTASTTCVVCVYHCSGNKTLYCST